MKLTSSVDDCRLAILVGFKVYAKNRMGDWIEVDQVNFDGSARVADSLSGFNSGIVGQMMTFDDPNIELCIRDFEIQ